MRIIIAGSRSFNNYTAIRKELNEFFADNNVDMATVEIVSGGASGADSLGERYAREYNLKLEVFPADWSNLSYPDARIKVGKYGRYDANAGHRRNHQMAKYASENACGVLHCWWDGSSPGTKSMISLAKENGLEVFVHRF